MRIERGSRYGYCPSWYERKINASNLLADPDRDTFRIDGGRRTGKIRWRKPHHFGFAPRVHSPRFARRRQNEVRAGGKSEEPVLADIVGLGSAFAGRNQTTSPFEECRSHRENVNASNRIAGFVGYTSCDQRHFRKREVEAFDDLPIHQMQ